MNIWPVMAAVYVQSRLGGTIFLNISLILHYISCFKAKGLKSFLVYPYILMNI